MKRINIALKDELHAQTKIISVLKNIPLTKYLEQCIEKGMQEDKKLMEKIKTLRKDMENEK
ncbi:MAG: hypothetical protein KKA51_06960 [Nanoarchaeota archaeon]|nr:hypothetical protein [Nanoarchaeota archaeon]